MIDTMWLWIGFNLFVLAMLALTQPALDDYRKVALV